MKHGFSQALKSGLVPIWLKNYLDVDQASWEQSVKHLGCTNSWLLAFFTS